MREVATQLILVAPLLVLTSSSLAQAQGADARTLACIEDNRIAQEEMRAGRYESGRAHALACAVKDCAQVLRDHCSKMAEHAKVELEQSEKSHPSKPAEPSSDGEPNASEQPEPSTAPTHDSQQGSETSSAQHSKVPSLALFGVAAVAVGSFGFFALSGRGKENDLSCGKACTHDQVDPITRDYLIADISLVIGVAAAAGGLLLWPWGDAHESRAALGIGPKQVRLRLAF